MNHKIVNTKGKEIHTDLVLHPGEVLEMEPEARGLKKTEFAASPGMGPEHLVNYFTVKGI